MENNWTDAMVFTLDEELPEYPEILPGYRRAPKRESKLSEEDRKLAIRNALRYIHPKHHAKMAKEFARELEESGRKNIICPLRFKRKGLK